MQRSGWWFGLVGMVLAGCASSDYANKASEGDMAYDEGDASTTATDGTFSDAEDDVETDTAEPEGDCDDVTPVQLFISPDDSNSMSSPSQVRLTALEGWSSLSHIPIRPWEFMNYYTFDYPPAPEGDLTIDLQMDIEASAADGEYVLQIGLASEAISKADRAPMNLTFVLDTSGSMSGTPMTLSKEVGYAVASGLKAGDTVSMVTWNTSNNVVLAQHPVDGPNDPVVVDAFESLSASGGTDLNGGLTAGYQLAQATYIAGQINRVFLVSDGGANVGVTDEQIIAEHAGDGDSDGIYMVGVGVGSATSYNDVLMDTVTDIGKGASVFIGTETEAWKVFSDRLVNTLDVAGRDVQIELDMPPGFEIVKFSGEEYSTDRSEIEPQHIAPNDAMVFYQTIATCAPEDTTDASEITVTATWRDPVTFEPRTASVTKTFGSMLDGDMVQLRKGAAVFKYTEALRAYKAGSHAEAVAEAYAALAAAEALAPTDGELTEIREVLDSLMP